MKTLIKTIFTDTENALNVVVIDTQETAIFNLINRKYFSIVKPLSDLIPKTKDVKEGDIFTTATDPFSLGIGDYKVFEVIKQKGGAVLRTEPTDYENYKIGLNYTDTYQTVCEAILERFEGYNMQTLKGIGVEDLEQKMDLNYEMLDQLLYKKHNILGFAIVS